jgi:hypothetical protein
MSIKKVNRKTRLILLSLLTIVLVLGVSTSFPCAQNAEPEITATFIEMLGFGEEIVPFGLVEVEIKNIDGAAQFEVDYELYDKNEGVIVETTPLTNLVATKDGKGKDGLPLIRYTEKITVRIYDSECVGNVDEKPLYEFRDIALLKTLEEPKTPRYELTSLDDDDFYTTETVNGVLIFTIGHGVTGFKYFGVKVKSIVEHVGEETVVFTHLKDNKQKSLNSVKADFDLPSTELAKSGFNIEGNDVIKVYIVDDLTNDIGRNPVILH